MKKFIIILFLFCSGSLLSRTVAPETKYPGKNCIGFSISGLSGNGISYNYMISEKFHLKGTGFIMTNMKDQTGYPNQYDSWYNYGLELQYNIIGISGSRFFVTLGGKYRFDKDDSSVSLYLQEREESQISGGTGVGLEFILDDNYFFNFDIGFQYFDSNREIFISGVRDEQRTESGIALFIGLGISYNF